ncbi:MAG: hypothetical protein IKV53_00780 [Clostridia bacterium]|nr:hypothetical protein [Clostridia bacterium]
MTKNEIPKNARELEKRIDKYFKSRLREQIGKNGEVVLDSHGKPIKNQDIPFTLTGLALALGLDSREALYSFEDEEMQRLVRRAVMRIEEYAEERLFSKDSFSGVKLFLTVNFDRWQDNGESVEDEYLLPEEAKKWSV